MKKLNKPLEYGDKNGNRIQDILIKHNEGKHGSEFDTSILSNKDIDLITEKLKDMDGVEMMHQDYVDSGLVDDAEPSDIDEGIDGEFDDLCYREFFA